MAQTCGALAGVWLASGGWLAVAPGSEANELALAAAALAAPPPDSSLGADAAMTAAVAFAHLSTVTSRAGEGNGYYGLAVGAAYGAAAAAHASANPAAWVAQAFWALPWTSLLLPNAAHSLAACGGALAAAGLWHVAADDNDLWGAGRRWTLPFAAEAVWMFALAFAPMAAGEAGAGAAYAAVLLAGTFAAATTAGGGAALSPPLAVASALRGGPLGLSPAAAVASVAVAFGTAAAAATLAALTSLGNLNAPALGAASAYDVAAALAARHGLVAVAYLSAVASKETSDNCFFGASVGLAAFAAFAANVFGTFCSPAADVAVAVLASWRGEFAEPVGPWVLAFVAGPAAGAVLGALAFAACSPAAGAAGDDAHTAGTSYAGSPGSRGGGGGRRMNTPRHGGGGGPARTPLSDRSGGMGMSPTSLGFSPIA